MLEHFCGMVGDIFFSELTINDMEGQGTVSCQEFGQIIGNTVVQVQIRLDPERKFSYPTKRTRVYNLVDDTDSVDQIESIQDPGINNSHEMPTDILHSEIIILIHNFGNAFVERVRKEQF